MAKFISKKVKTAFEISEKAQRLLKQHNEKYDGKQSKKLDFEQLLTKTPNLTKLEDFWIRDPKEWKAKSFNLHRQIVDFVTWLLCEYPVPLFMYKLFIPPPKNRSYSISYFNQLEEVYLDWFVTIGQGMSFKKASKGFLSKKEAHLFLKAPKDGTIPGNILLTKCRARNVSTNVTTNLCTRWADRYSNTNKHYWDSIINFYSKYPTIDASVVQDTMDFINTAFQRDSKFSLSGRTLNSIIQLTNEWHIDLQHSKGIGVSAWPGLMIPEWKLGIDEDKDVWYITQITDSKKLFHEGKVMKHCVSSYLSSCDNGRSGIFTVEHKYYGTKSKCLTIEVNSNFDIVQIRGKCNRPPDKSELKILNKWVADRQLKYMSFIKW